MRWCVTLLLLSVFMTGAGVGYSISSPSYTYFLYMFQHSGVVHLVINLLSLCSFLQFLRKVIPVWLLFVYVYCSAVIAACFSAVMLPTVGASGVIYSCVGIYLSLLFWGKRLKVGNKRSFFMWLCVIAVGSVVSAFNPHINNLNHLAGFCSGIVAGTIDNFFRK